MTDAVAHNNVLVGNWAETQSVKLLRLCLVAGSCEGLGVSKCLHRREGQVPERHEEDNDLHPLGRLLLGSFSVSGTEEAEGKMSRSPCGWGGGGRGQGWGRGTEMG